MSDLDLLLDAAVTAAARGWPVFVLGRSKRPLANCPECPKRGQPGAHDPETCPHLTCHGFYAATTDPARLAVMVAAHPDGLLAVRTGAAPAGADVVVVDIDPGHGGRLDTDLMTPTLAVGTDNHGWHLYYRHPGPPVLSRRLPGHVGVDVKADGGYVVLPPSVHPDTRRPYRWANQRGIEEMPPRWMRWSSRHPQRRPNPHRTRHWPSRSGPGPAPPGSGGRIRHPEKLVDACLDTVRHAPEGRRRYTLYGTPSTARPVVSPAPSTPASTPPPVASWKALVVQLRNDLPLERIQFPAPPRGLAAPVHCHPYGRLSSFEGDPVAYPNRS